MLTYIALILKLCFTKIVALIAQNQVTIKSVIKITGMPTCYHI